MPRHKSVSRTQLQMLSLEEYIESDAEVRVIDAFVKALNFQELGFIEKGQSVEGRPAFQARILAALYLYGYLNGINSSRKLEKACKCNVELWWLLDNQKPGYKTISNFRKDNIKGFRNIFNVFRNFCVELGLYGKKVVAIDGSKFRAQNSKKNNYNIKKVNDNLEYIDKQEEYVKSLEQNDETEQKLESIQKRRSKYEGLKSQLNEIEDTQISTTDPDARALPLHMNIVEVSYNVQTAVDDKNCMIANFEVTNEKDHESLHRLSKETKEALNPTSKTFTVLADKGYHSGEQIQKCHEEGIQTLVAPKKKSSKSKDPRVTKGKFKYSKKHDQYKCPKGKILKRQGGEYTRKDSVPYKRYVASYKDCKKCPWLEICLSQSNQRLKKGRYLNRNIYEDALDRNDAKVKRKKKLYKRRQAIVEHPYGTIKRQWGKGYTLLKGLEKVNGEFAIVLQCYNLRRAISILGVTELIKALKLALLVKSRITIVMKYVRGMIADFYHSPSQHDQFLVLKIG